MNEKYEKYKKYKNSVNNFTEKFQFRCMSSTEEDGFFSWTPCPVCGQGAGNRYRSTLVDMVGDFEHFDLCADCVCYLEYGKLDDVI